MAKEYLEPLQAAAVDTLVLGCTHYPLLAGPISYVMGRNVALVSSSEETAKDVYRELAARNLLHTDTQAAVGSGDDDGASGSVAQACVGADGAAQGAAGAAAAGGSGLAGGAGSANAVKQVSRQSGAQGASSGTATSSAAASGASSGHEFRATGDPVAFQVLAKRFLGPVVGQVRQAHAAGGAGVKNLDREIRE